MQHTFLKLAFYFFIALLWALFATCTGLSYWTPMRTLPDGVPITVSPLHWTAISSYVAALGFIAAYHLTAPGRNIIRIITSIAAIGTLFMVTAVILENQFYFNAHDSEKSQTSLLILGCSAPAVGTIILSALLLTLVEHAEKRA